MFEAQRSGPYDDIVHVVTLNSSHDHVCAECEVQLRGEDLGAAINHYLEKHRYKLLYLGAENRVIEKNAVPWSTTVAVLGLTWIARQNERDSAAFKWPDSATE